MNVVVNRRRAPWLHHELPECRRCGIPHSRTPFDTIPDDVMLRVFFFLTIPHLARLRATSIHFMTIVADMIYDRCFSLYESFGIAKQDMSKFFGWLEYHHCLTIGIGPLRILHPYLDPPRELQILTTSPSHHVASTLIDNFEFDMVGEGYGSREVSNELGFAYFGLSTPYFTRVAKKTSLGETKTWLIVGSKDMHPVIGTVTELPTTALMNFISPDGFYSLYPRLTDEAKGILTIPVDVLRPDMDGVEGFNSGIPAIDLLIRQGFEIVSNPSRVIGTHCCGVHPECPATPRIFPGPPMLYSAFHTRRNCLTEGSMIESPLFYTLRNASACGRPVSSEREECDSDGIHVVVSKSITGESRATPVIVPCMSRRYPA